MNTEKNLPDPIHDAGNLENNIGVLMATIKEALTTQYRERMEK